jgi:hypothetical protein
LQIEAAMTNLRRLLLPIICLAATACGGLLNPEAGMWVPVDPGTVFVRVIDSAGAPLREVYVEIGNIPNNVGSTFSEGQWTRPDGTATFDFIPAGGRTATVTPPSGYAAGADGNTRSVTVVTGQTSTVLFQLARS